MRALEADPSPVDQYPVDFRIWTNDTAIGEDRGIAYFADGWLCFEGLQSHFSLRPEDMFSVRDETDFASNEFDGLKFPFKIQYVLENRTFTLKFRPRKHSNGQMNAFSLAFKAWEHPSGEWLSEATVYPPARVHPNAPNQLLAPDLRMALYAAWLIWAAVVFRDLTLIWWVSIAVIELLMLGYVLRRRRRFNQLVRGLEASFPELPANVS